MSSSRAHLHQRLSDFQLYAGASGTKRNRDLALKDSQSSKGEWQQTMPVRQGCKPYVQPGTEKESGSAWGRVRKALCKETISAGPDRMRLELTSSEVA